MAFRPIFQYFLRTQRPESPSPSSAVHAASSVLLIPLTFWCISPDQPPLPPSWASMQPCSSIFLWSFVLWVPSPLPDVVVPYYFAFLYRPSHSTGLPSRFVPPVLFSLSLALPLLDFSELTVFFNHPFVNILEPESAAFLTNFISSDVQPLSLAPTESSARVVFNNLPPSPDRHDCERPFD